MNGQGLYLVMGSTVHYNKCCNLHLHSNTPHLSLLPLQYFHTDLITCVSQGCSCDVNTLLSLCLGGTVSIEELLLCPGMKVPIIRLAYVSSWV